jgi:hypothetical protein
MCFWDTTLPIDFLTFNHQNSVSKLLPKPFVSKPHFIWVYGAKRQAKDCK